MYDLGGPESCAFRALKEMLADADSQGWLLSPRRTMPLSMAGKMCQPELRMHSCDAPQQSLVKARPSDHKSVCFACYVPAASRA